MKKITSFFSQLATEIDLQSFLRKLVFVVGIAVFIGSIANITGMLYATRAPKGTIYARDNDAGRGVQTATLTKWWNSNHFAPYGNLYFRFAHTLESFAPSSSPENLIPEEQNEVRHHFALMMTSLLFLSGLCLFLSYTVSSSWFLSFWYASVLLKLGTYDFSWAEFLFRAHPDHTLMFFCLLSSLMTLRYTKTNSHKDFVIAGLLWGVATAVKRSTVLFIPSFLYLFLSEGLNKESLKKGCRFAGYMFLAYLIVGFPQNFGLLKHLHFMRIETFNSLPPTKESVLDYLHLIFTQSVWLWFALIFFHVVAGKKEDVFTKRFFIFSLIAIMVVLAGNMSSRHNHHIMPHVALLLVLVIALSKKIPTISHARREYFAIGSTLVALLYLPDSKALIERKKLQLECRSEIENVLSISQKSLSESAGNLIRDPYFPFTASIKDKTKQIWGVNGEILDKENALLWGTEKLHLHWLSLKPYRPHIYPDLTEAQWNEKVKLALLAQKESTFTTPNGRVFEKIHEDRCGFQIWKRKD